MSDLPELDCLSTFCRFCGESVEGERVTSYSCKEHYFIVGCVVINCPNHPYQAIAANPGCTCLCHIGAAKHIGPCSCVALSVREQPSFLKLPVIPSIPKEGA